MRAAAMWRVPPTVYLEQWSERDRSLAEGHIVEQDGICSCGNQRSLCHHPDTQGQWDVIDDVCYATEALEDAASGDGEKPEPGLMRHAILKSDYTPPRLSVLREQLQITHDKDRGVIR